MTCSSFVRNDGNKSAPVDKDFSHPVAALKFNEIEYYSFICKVLFKTYDFDCNFQDVFG